MADARPKVSVVVPFYNEEDSIEPLHAAIVTALEPLAIPFEMVFVDDGSRDATLERARHVAQRDGRVRIVTFRRNYGQTAAMAAGIEHAGGEVIVTMDGDLQNDPADIAEFLRQIEAGHDIVIGWRHNRQDKLVSRKIPSRVANWLIGKVTGIPIKDNGCSLKAYRAELIKAIPLYSEMHRFIPAMASLAGPSIVQVKVRHHARRFGTSKYGLSRIYRVLLDLLVIKTLVTFAARPLLWFALLAVPLMVLGSAALGYALIAAGLGRQTPWLPMAGAGIILLSSAFIMLCSGALGELIYNLGDLREHEFARLTQRLHSTYASERTGV